MSKNQIDEIIETLKPIVEKLEKFEMVEDMKLLEGYLYIKDAIVALGEAEAREV